MNIILRITDRRDNRFEVKVPTDMGLNLMQVIRAYEFEPEGTVGVCGGVAMCSTCQCYIENDVKVPERKELEAATLSRLQHVKPNSRLGCQIPITKDLEGLEIALAPMM